MLYLDTTGGHMKKAIVVGIVLILVVGGGVLYANRAKLYGGSTANTTMPSMPSSNDSSSHSASSTNTVTIDNYAFNPTAITVKKGTTVTWTNKDSAPHTVTESDGKDGPNSGNLATADSYSFTFNTVGTFKYKCSIHASMVGSVTVTE